MFSFYQLKLLVGIIDKNVNQKILVPQSKDKLSSPLCMQVNLNLKSVMFRCKGLLIYLDKKI